MEIAIIGAGICGLYLSWKLSEKGFNVTVFERREKIGKATCSGLFSQRILDFIPQSRKLIENRIEYTVLHFPKKTLRIKFSKEFFVMNHCELDRLVAELARNSNTKVLLNNNIARKDIAVLQNDFERVIGCDGPNSIVRKSLELKDPQFRLGIQGFITKKDFSNFVEVWATKHGFLWKIPRGRQIEYGVIEKTETAKKVFDEFLRKRNIYLEKMNSALIPQGFIIPDNPRLTLCGDAAGLTKSWSGGGVIWGLLAANILLKNFPDFLKYRKELKKFFLPKIIFSDTATKLVYFLGFKIPWVFPKNLKMENDFLL